jgi:hypothetical protein
MVRPAIIYGSETVNAIKIKKPHTRLVGDDSSFHKNRTRMRGDGNKILWYV